MTLSFPNQSRFYDATRRAVRFWGHDSAMEASFVVNADASKRIKPDMPPDEAGLLSAFDSNRKLIYATAAEVYERRRRGLTTWLHHNFFADATSFVMFELITGTERRSEPMRMPHVEAAYHLPLLPGTNVASDRR